MVICIPALTNSGTTAGLSEHFGSAPYYTIYDSAKEMLLNIQNPGSDHTHEKCRPVDSLTEYCIEAVLCRGIGALAMAGLKAAGIRVYATDAATVGEAIDAALRGGLPEIDMDACCTENDAHCG